MLKKTMVMLLVLVNFSVADEYFFSKGISYDTEANRAGLTFGMVSKYSSLTTTYDGDVFSATWLSYFNATNLKIGGGIKYDDRFNVNPVVGLSVYVTSYMDIVVETTIDNTSFKILIYK